MRISGTTRLCALIGDPVEHSLSPTMHNAAFENLRMDFVYLAFRISNDELQNVMASVRSLNIYGLNVTMPHKKTVIKYLNKVDPTAKFIDAVNTVNNEDGKLVGYNTDGLGALRALKENGVNLKNKKLVLLGAGGAAKAIAFHVGQEIAELVILNRTIEKAEKLALVLRGRFNVVATARRLTSESIGRELEGADILINATAVGMYPDVETSPVDPRWLRSDLCVMDTVYNPLTTKLVGEACSVGAKVVSGIDMLVYQGAASFEIWTSRSAPIDVMKRAVMSELSRSGSLFEGTS